MWLDVNHNLGANLLDIMKGLHYNAQFLMKIIRMLKKIISTNKEAHIIKLWGKMIILKQNHFGIFQRTGIKIQENMSKILCNSDHILAQEIFSFIQDYLIMNLFNLYLVIKVKVSLIQMKVHNFHKIFNNITQLL